MSFFKNIQRRHDPATNVITVSADLSNMEDVYLHHRIISDVADELVKILAQQYAEEYGPKILKALQRKTIDAKLIQKVVANLRKELSNANNESR